MYGIGLKEATDGKYYVAGEGNKLHLNPACQYLYYSSRVIKDKTNTLSYRVKRGDRVLNPGSRYYRLVTSHCWYCTVDHRERHAMSAR